MTYPAVNIAESPVENDRIGETPRPPKRRRVANQSPILPAICILCEKERKYKTGCMSTTVDKLHKRQSKTAGMLVKSVTIACAELVGALC